MACMRSNGKAGAMSFGDHLKEKEVGPVVLSGLCCRCRKQGCEGLRGGCEEGRLEDTGVGAGAGGSGGTEGTQALALNDSGPGGGLELAGMCPGIERVENRLQGARAEQGGPEVS